MSSPDGATLTNAFDSFRLIEALARLPTKYPTLYVVMCKTSLVKGRIAPDDRTGVKLRMSTARGGTPFAPAHLGEIDHVAIQASAAANGNHVATTDAFGGRHVVERGADY